ncbi:hypothetical protein [Pelagicoccus albus]|uniref:Uncharacterized protein n=1 Tax=Pelagicoccus albus TaxID=415222 RepID=A0A7X1B7Q6_9BACT|nr:hypothetical protein [Pelagicoccus albus]MBC2605940.1 hypothetical protein [Pelagicoccus albus]
MISTDNRQKLANELETIVAYTNDSVKGFEKATDKIDNSNETLKQFFLSTVI